MEIRNRGDFTVAAYYVDLADLDLTINFKKDPNIICLVTVI